MTQFDRFEHVRYFPSLQVDSRRTRELLALLMGFRTLDIWSSDLEGRTPLEQAASAATEETVLVLLNRYQELARSSRPPWSKRPEVTPLAIDLMKQRNFDTAIRWARLFETDSLPTASPDTSTASRDETGSETENIGRPPAIPTTTR